jgi:nitrogen fixation NifU-like protein
MVTDMEYSKKVMQLFMHPHNIGEIKNPDAVGKVGNPTCGDLMWVYLKVKNNSNGEPYIEDIKVKTFGCVSAIASSSISTDLVKGKTLKEAENLTKERIVKRLGGLPPIKFHCSVLAVDAIREAVRDYYIKNKIPVSKTLEDTHRLVLKELETIGHKHF